MFDTFNRIKLRLYFRLIIFNLLAVFVFQVLYLLCVEKIFVSILLKNIVTCIIFMLCSIVSVIITVIITKENRYIDLLTGTYTREKMYHDLTKLIKNNQKFILMYIDLNNFKQINDTYGHIAGDKVLEDFGTQILKLGDDINCYRMGGDEFILIAGNQTVTKSKLKRFIDLKEFDFSYGISEFPVDSSESCSIKEIIEKLIFDADDKMYKNKLENRVR